MDWFNDFYKENQYAQMAAAIIRTICCLLSAGYVLKDMVLADYADLGLIIMGSAITLLISLSVIWKRFEW